MPPAAAAPLLSLLLLCGLRGVLLSRIGRCSGGLCVFRSVLDFNGAETECRNSQGQLLSFSSEEQLLDRFKSLSGFSGTFWLRRSDRKSEEAAEGFQTCPSVSVGLNVSVEWKSCTDELSGFLCEFGDVCSRTQSSGGGPVTYTTFAGFLVTESESFPPGTTAEEREGGGGPPASKHLCFSSSWIKAPWNCEVLDGGCEFGCDSETNTCTCPEGRMLQPNQVSCTEDPCSAVREGFRLGQDGRSCVDIDECKEKDPCTAEGQECENLQGGSQCVCREDFEWEDGGCVNVSICSRCEHMNCQKISGVYMCVCRKGFRVSPEDPTKCEPHCSERDCPARCEKNPEQEKKEQQQCFCPEGYIVDIRDGTSTCTDINECESQDLCEHQCENLFGSYRCLCNEGFQLQDESRCVPLEEPGEVVEGGSGSTESVLPEPSRPADRHTLPSYIRTGSILGITVFLLLCLGLLCFLIQYAVRRCGKFELSPLKRPDINIFYLQQVTTETYKRLSLDKQLKNEQRI
ncbi:thrombomodulin-like [Acanthochromis polyacanthus]|uniref:thrombomodulin-like n=1 Tax=Acanthochromis polyacanthus TaxID=80966 RepID=UPI00223492DE|nr:thrombomodulin-like [Acanthochromis polyacanthus]